MQFSRNNLITTYHFFLRIMQLKSMQCSGFNLSIKITICHPITSNNCNNAVPIVCTVFDIVCWYSKKRDPRSCLGTLTVEN